MKLLKSYRIIALALALVLCFSAVSRVATVATADESVEPIVRVGMYADAPLLDTRRFSSNNISQTGFDIGTTDGEHFNTLFSLDNKSVILLSQVNARIVGDRCVADENGGIGAYSAVIGRFQSFSSAQSAAKKHDGFVAIVNGGFEARKCPSNTANESKTASGGMNVASPVSGGITVIDAESANILFTFENTSAKLAIRARNGGAVKIPMKHYSGAENRFEYIGFFEYTVSSGLLYMVNCLGLEDYTKCVMANEIGTNVSTETRKAFSILARTVPIASKHSGRGFNVCNNEACCQVYFGIYRMSEENNAIVDSTRGLVCRYNGKPINVLYHNSNGGASCSSVAAWGGNEVPYLTTVFQEELAGGDKWEHEYTQREFFEYLTSRKTFSGLSDDDISMKILAKDPYGSDYITVLSVSDGSGNTVTVETSETVRNAMGYTSANFEIHYSVDMEIVTAEGKVEQRPVSGIMTADGYKALEGFGDTIRTAAGVSVNADKVVIKGSGIGHGVGFSATGSEKLARDGYNYKYILTSFFKGITIETI